MDEQTARASPGIDELRACLHALISNPMLTGISVEHAHKLITMGVATKRQGGLLFSHDRAPTRPTKGPGVGFHFSRGDRSVAKRAQAFAFGSEKQYST